MCFACGKDNSFGLGLKIIVKDGQAGTTFIPAVTHEGPNGLAHGGIIATALDETMVNLLWAQGKDAVTAELKVRFSQPVKIGQSLNIVARETKAHHKLMEMEAVATDINGKIIVKGSGKFLLKKEVLP
jgi:uncharacterized protein (TIGR00369 family)